MLSEELEKPEGGVLSIYFSISLEASKFLSALHEVILSRRCYSTTKIPMCPFLKPNGIGWRRLPTASYREESFVMSEDTHCPMASLRSGVRMIQVHSWIPSALSPLKFRAPRRSSALLTFRRARSSVDRQWNLED